MLLSKRDENRRTAPTPATPAARCGEIVKRRVKCRLAAVALFQLGDNGTFGMDDENLDDLHYRLIN